MSNKENVVNSLQEIVRLRGIDVLKDEKQVFNMITDLAPSDKIGKRRLRNLYETNTIPLFLGVDKKSKAEITKVVKVAGKKLSNEIGLSEDAAQECVRVLIDALGIPYIFPHKQAQTEQNTNISQSNPSVGVPPVSPSSGPIVQPIPSVKQKRSFVPFLMVLVVGLLCMLVYAQFANSRENSSNLSSNQEENSVAEVPTSSLKENVTEDNKKNIPTLMATTVRPSSYQPVNDFNVTGTSIRSSMGSFSYEPSKVFDNDLNTAWVEGVSGDGSGESLTFTYKASSSFFCEGFAINNGYCKSTEVFNMNGAPTQVSVYVNDEKRAVVQLQSIMDTQYIDWGEWNINPSDTIRITIDAVWEGPEDDDHDTAISELHFY